MDNSLMLHGIIVLNAYVRNSSQLSQAERLREELLLLGCDVQIIRNIDIARIKNGRAECVESDFCVFLDKDKVVCELLEKSGMRVFNKASAIEVCDNKMMTHIALSNLDISMPDCMYAPLCYYEDAKTDVELISSVGHALGFPLIAKTSYGSLGDGVYKINSEKELFDFESSKKLTEHFYQKYIASEIGCDIRCIVVGGRFLTSYMRVNQDDFRSNIEQGGKGVAYYAESDVVSLCEKVSQFLALDYCGIDILKSGDDYYLCEVNSNAFFKVAEKVTGVNIAKAYAEHIVNVVSSALSC